MSDGISFAGGGENDLLNNSYSTTPKGSGNLSGNGVSFVDNAGGDDVSKSLNTANFGNKDPVSHSMSGKGFSSIIDNE